MDDELRGEQKKKTTAVWLSVWQLDNGLPYRVRVFFDEIGDYERVYREAKWHEGRPKPFGFEKVYTLGEFEDKFGLLPAFRIRQEILKCNREWGEFTSKAV